MEKIKSVVVLTLLLLCGVSVAQVKPKVSLIGGDDVPQLKKQFETTIETVLLEMNKLEKKTGDINILKRYFSAEALEAFKQFVLQNKAYTARKQYSPLLIVRENGQFYDVRSLTVKVDLGQTEASDSQNLIFTFSRSGQIVSVRSMLPNYDFQSVVSAAKSPQDSIMRGRILDFLEEFRMAYNTKNSEFLEKVFSDEALIIVGSVLQEKKREDDVFRGSSLSSTKVKLIQQTKREYLDGLKNKAFKNNSFISVRFDDVNILQHEKIPEVYGVTCWQQWASSTYKDKGYLFLMVDFRLPKEPTIHVRTWQPNPFEDGSYVSLYDFDVIKFE
ncbi:MAG: hypothetical protein NTU47_00235 [Ignavibacteriales bacterium]|nr:hypothetical protein [Ignavibacteriales bacterium]